MTRNEENEELCGKQDHEKNGNCTIEVFYLFKIPARKFMFVSFSLKRSLIDSLVDSSLVSFNHETFNIEQRSEV